MNKRWPAIVSTLLAQQATIVNKTELLPNDYIFLHDCCPFTTLCNANAEWAMPKTFCKQQTKPATAEVECKLLLQ